MVCNKFRCLTMIGIYLRPLQAFLQKAASRTECQSGSAYKTLIMTIHEFRAQATKSHIAIDDGDQVINPIAEKMLAKIGKNWWNVLRRGGSTGKDSWS